MSKASEIMVPAEKVVVIKRDDSIREAVRKLAENKVSGAPVVEQGKVVGVVSESDILRFFERKRGMRIADLVLDSEKVEKTKIYSIMTKKVVGVGPDATLGDVARIMSERKINRVVVVDDRMALLGLIARADVVKAGRAQFQ